MCMMRRQQRRTSISAIFAMFLFPVGLLKYRTKSRKGSPWVIILVSSKKVIKDLESREATEDNLWSGGVAATLGQGWGRRRIRGQPLAT